MAMKGLGLIALLAALFFFMPVVFGGTQMLSAAGLLLTVAIFLSVLKIRPLWLAPLRQPGFLKGNTGTVIVLAVLVLSFGSFGYGWTPAFLSGTMVDFSSILQGATITGATVLTAPAADGTEVQMVTSECRAMFTDEQLDETASVNLRTYDLASSSGMTSAVDLTTNCWLYANGNSPDDFRGKSADTEDAATTSIWNLGDTAYVYCGGTSYYTVPAEGVCIDGPTKTIEMDSYAICSAVTDLVISGFDKNGNALTAAGNTSTADYDVTLGASQTEIVSFELLVNSNTETYNLMALAMDTWNDIDSVSPKDTGLFKGGRQGYTPDYLDSLAVSSDENSDLGNTANVTLSYEVWYLNEPILMKEWDTVEYSFKVKAGSTDPTASDADFDGFDGASVCFLDGTYSRGHDGKMYYDIHDHAEDGSEADVGLANKVDFPVDKDDCVVLEGA
jgi:hypothetical protein